MKRESAEIQVACFDIGNVIFKFANGIRWMSGLLNAPEEDVRTIWLSMDDRACRGEIEVQEIWDTLVLKFGYKGEPVAFIERWAENFVAIAETHQLLTELCPVMPVGLLTNVYRGGYEVAITNGSIPNLNYRFVVKSYQVGAVKPDEKIYRVAERSAGVEPRRILLVDDLQANIDMARSRSWKAIRFDPTTPTDSVKLVRDFLLD